LTATIMYPKCDVVGKGTGGGERTLTATIMYHKCNVEGKGEGGRVP
jgi:hypothetical protein